MYAGPLRRTINTAQIVADECRVPDVRILHGLTNLDYGAWEGMTAEEAAMYDPEMFKLYRSAPDRAVCPNGERLTDAQNRMVEAVRLDRAAPCRRAGRGGHPRRDDPTEVVAARTATDGEDWRIPVGRGSLTEFEVEKGSIRVTALPEGNDVD